MAAPAWPGPPPSSAPVAWRPLARPLTDRRSLRRPRSDRARCAEHAGFGPRRIATELARPKWGGIVVSKNGVWRVLCRHGLNTRARRLALIAGYRAPYEPPRDPAPEPHIEVERPGELVGMDCFYVGRLRGTAGAIWQLTAIDLRSSYALG